MRSFEQAVDPVPSEIVSPATPPRVNRSEGPSAVGHVPLYTPRPVQHPRLSLQRRAPSTLRRHLARAASRFEWVERARLDRLPLSTTTRKALALLAETIK